jgi:metallophosphoesterase superfamily enzyme
MTPEQRERKRKADRERMVSMKERARAPRALLGGTTVRVIIPDSHGNHIDLAARDACLRDVKAINPSHVVLLGDHLDCGGTFSSHQRTYTNEMAESYADDVEATNTFLDLLQDAAPSAKEWDYLEGNHEQHVERWAARNFHNQRDADALLEAFGPEKVLGLKRRHIKYYKRSVQYDDVSIPGCIRRGKCHFVHGISHSKHAAATHLSRFGASVVFGHIHRSQSVVERSVTSNGYGAWCPGTLAKLQPLYKHTEPSSWSHGYGVQFVNPSGNFIHVNVPILNGESMLAELLGAA